jgi:hypothetical protein
MDGQGHARVLLKKLHGSCEINKIKDTLQYK